MAALLPTVTEAHPESEDDKILFMSLLPLAHLALARAASLRELKLLLEMAYFREAKKRGLTHRQTADLMSISEPKTALLARQLKAFFTEAESDEPLARQVLALLRCGPMTATRIDQFLGDATREAVTDALESLVERGLIEAFQSDRSVVRYRLSTGEFRQGHDGWAKKLDGLSTFLRSVARLVEARFFHNDERAAARRLDFRIRRDDVATLLRFYEEQLLPLVRRLDEAACASPDSIPIELALHWVPGSDEGRA